jgi:methyl-accepting chemotaxis protein
MPLVASLPVATRIAAFGILMVGVFVSVSSVLVSTANTKVQEGIELVREAGQAPNETRSHNRSVAETVKKISGSAVEQAHGIEEIGKAPGHLDGMTRQNAAFADESAAAASLLTRRFEPLATLVAVFRTSSGQSKARAHGGERQVAKAP